MLTLWIAILSNVMGESMRYSRWTKEQDSILKDMYVLADRETILRLIPGRSWESIQVRANSIGLTGRVLGTPTVHSYDHNYFSVPNIENSYWAGFIAADGNVRVDNNCPILQIKLHIGDRQHIEKFVRCTQYTNVTRVTTNKNSGKEYAYIKYNGAHRYLYDLSNHFNVTPRKTTALQPPNIINHDMIMAYIVGYIDGDGSVFYSAGRLHITVIGTYQLMVWVKQNILPMVGECKAEVLKHKGIWQFGISGKNAEQFKSIVLSMGLPVLDRKWNKEWISPHERKTEIDSLAIVSRT